MNDRIEKRIELNAPISRVWRVVSREGGRTICARPDLPWPDDLSRLRAHQVGSHGAENGARAALFVHLASSQIHRKSGLSRRLLERTDHARRIPAGENRQWYVAGADRVRLRQASRRSPSRSVPKKRRRLDRTNEEHRKICHTKAVTAQPSNGRVPLYLRRSATRCGWRWWRSSVPGSLVRSLS